MKAIIQLAIFVLVSTGIVALSWRSFRDPRSHGFFRFFAFEAILLLFLLNITYWFREPFSVWQILSWLLLLVSLLLVIHGFYLLRAIGQPEGPIENTTVLVKRGAYRYIRHPLYSSLLFFAWGVFFKAPSVTAGTLTVVTTVFLFATARAEEAENIGKFGADYVEYMHSTRMFIPFLF